MQLIVQRMLGFSGAIYKQTWYYVKSLTWVMLINQSPFLCY